MTSFFKKIRKDLQANLPTQIATPEPPADPPVTLDSFVGEVRLTAASFAPPGWALCHGQLLDITAATSLFSLLGTTFGGDGRTTFGLPDLRGRSAIGAGQLAGLPLQRLGHSGTDEPGHGTPAHGYQALNYIICVEGVFPERT